MTFQLHSGNARPQGGVLKATIPGRVGDVIYDHSGNPLTLTRLIGSGGEGSVFAVSDGRVAKFYHPAKATEAVRDKLHLMIRQGPPQGAAVCWPESFAVTNSQPRKWLGGTIMPAASGIPLQQLLLKPVLTSRFPNWTRKHLVQLARTVLTTVSALHRHGVLLGDINLLNILVTDETKITFVDCDSFQIEDFACPVGKLPFIRPARVSAGFDFSKQLRTMDDDLFATAVLAFMILLPGKPPFSHTGGNDVVANCREARFPYPWGSRWADGLPVGPWQYIWSHLTEKLKNAFGKTFEEGEFIAADDWIQLLDNYLWAIDNGYSCNDLFPTTVKEPDADAIAANGGEKLTCKIKGCERTFGLRAGRTLKYQICPQCRSRQYPIKCPLCGSGFFVTAAQIFRAEDNEWNLFCPS
jgi:DNA-binding helix-hairpin-helix protein with protein kinase domain